MFLVRLYSGYQQAQIQKLYAKILMCMSSDDLGPFASKTKGDICSIAFSSDYGKGVFVLFTGRLGIVSLAFRLIGRYSWFHRDSALSFFAIAAKQATF